MEDKIHWYPREIGYTLEKDQVVVVKCPEWCEAGFQVASWNGVEFEYADQPNDKFHGNVVSFAFLR